MKKVILIFIILFTTQLPAQPGSQAYIKEKTFEHITQLLQDNPNNYELIWKRLNIYNLYFNLYQKGGIVQNHNILKQPETISLNKWSYEEKLADLNLLIENKIEITENESITDMADFTLMRGQIYYLIGEYEKALADYNFALDAISKSKLKRENKYLKHEIYISLAAYYYNKKEANEIEHKTGNGKENLRQALRYIDMISPVENTDNFSYDNLYNYSERIQDRYEDEKIKLLKSLHEDARLKSYYIKLMRNEYELFKKDKARENEWSKYNAEETNHNYFTNEKYLNALDYAYELANYYFESKNYKKAKWLAEEIIQYYPTNSVGYIVNRIEVGKLYLLLNKIYQTKGFINFDQEMNTLMELLGGFAGGVNYDISEIGKYLTERLQKYPNEPRLYLALGIWHYKNSMSSSYPPTLSTAEILNLFDKTEKLKLKDYRLPFAKALVYLYLEKNYDLGLSEINQALKLFQNNPSIYNIKHELLLKLSNNYIDDLQELSDNNLKKYKKMYYKDMSNLFMAIEKK